MANINVLHPLDAVVSVFTPNAIIFDYTHDGVVGSYAEVVVDGYTFGATKTDTLSGSADRYTFDLSDILKFLISKPSLTDITVSGLFTVKTFTINGRLSNGALQATVNTFSSLTFSLPDVGNTLLSLRSTGRSSSIYHSGVISFMWYDDPGTVALIVGGVSINYTLATGYNIVTLHASQLVTGTLTSSPSGLSIPLIYIPSTDTPITWLDRDGAYSYCAMRLVSKGTITRSENPVPIFNLSNGDANTLDDNNTRTRTGRVTLDVVARDAEHYRQLTTIGDSMRVWYGGLLYRAVSIPTDTADCRQNLYFQITLERSENAAGY